jgi:hypothetical protein
MCAALVCGCGALGMLGVMAGAASAAGLSWSEPAPAGAGGYISCASTALCVSVGSEVADTGYAVITTDPTAATPTWSTAEPIDASGSPTGVSCPSTSLCVAVDDNGNAVITTDPTAATPTWSTAKQIDPGQEPTGVSCASTALCVAVDNNGNEVTSTNPTAPTPTWSTAKQIDAATMTGGGFLAQVSCPSTSLCVSTQAEGDAVVTSNPTALSPAWSSPDSIDTGHLLIGLSCTAMSTSFCVATDNYGNVWVTNNPSDPSAWSTSVNVGGGSGVSCASTSLCVAIGGAAGKGLGDAAISSDPTANAWSAGSPIDGNPLASISCPSTSLCVAIDLAGNAVVGHGSGVAQPTSISPPTISGHPVELQTLTESHGSWTNSPTSFSYAWEDCDSSGGSCQAISGATGQSYTLASSDVGHTIRVIETASNAGGVSAPASSAASGVVLAPPAPKISAVSQSASKWVEDNLLAKISSRKKLPVGTTFSLTLSEAATVSFAFTQSLAGRKVGKRCVAQTKHNTGKPRCRSTVTVGTLTFAAKAGKTTVRFGGRVSRHLKLKSGSYTLVITATASKKTSAPHTLQFTIA